MKRGATPRSTRCPRRLLEDGHSGPSACVRRRSHRQKIDGHEYPSSDRRPESRSQPTSGDFGGGASGRERWPQGETSRAKKESPPASRSFSENAVARIRGSVLTSSIGRSVGPQPHVDFHAGASSRGVAAGFAATSVLAGFFCEQHPPGLVGAGFVAAVDDDCLRVEQQPPEVAPAALFAQQHFPVCLALFEQRHHGEAAESSVFPNKLQSPTGMPMLDAVNEINTSNRTQCQPTQFTRSHSRERFVANGIRRKRDIGRPSRTDRKGQRGRSYPDTSLDQAAATDFPNAGRLAVAIISGRFVRSICWRLTCPHFV